MADREAQMDDAGLEIVLQAGDRRRQVSAIGRHQVVAQDPRQGRRGRLIASLGARLELGPEVVGNLALEV